MTISPVRFGWAYTVHGTQAERTQAWTDADSYAAHNSLDLDVLDNVEPDTDIYFTEGDAATYQQHQAEIARYFQVRRETLEEAQTELKKSLSSHGPASQAEKDAFAKYAQVVANDKLNHPLEALNSLWGINVDPYIMLQGGGVGATDITNQWVDVATGQ